MRTNTQDNQELCAVCGGELRDTTITHQERRGEKFYLFHNVPAQVCAACGEIWIDEKTLKRIDQLTQAGRPTGKVETPVFDLAGTRPK